MAQGTLAEGTEWNRDFVCFLSPSLYLSLSLSLVSGGIAHRRFQFTALLVPIQNPDIETRGPVQNHQDGFVRRSRGCLALTYAPSSLDGD